MRKLLAWALIFLLTFALCLPVLRAETEDEIWTLVTQEGIALTRIGTKVSVGDEYISGDNTVYRVISVDEAKREATVAPIGEEAALTQAFFLVQPVAQNAKRVGLYCTHSDESYENGDGTSSIETGWAGIHDVAATLKSWLEDKGIEVDFDTGTFLPHDAGAYRRSRSATASLVKKGPAAIFDIHRDGIPDAAEYETQVNGEKMTMVRLLVGRSNPNSAENRQFAVQLKSVADELYPGLVKDIFIGKGNYNQELLPDSVLLEFGTHTSDKEQVLTSTAYMADVINVAVFGASPGQSQKKDAQNAAPQQAETTQPEGPKVSQQSAQTETGGRSGIWTAMGWIVGIVLLGGLTFSLVASGGFGGFGERVKRFSSEISGGLFGKKPKE